MTGEAPSCFHSSMRPWPSRTHPMGRSTVLLGSTRPASWPHLPSFITVSLVPLTPVTLVFFSYKSVLTIHVLAPEPLNLLFSWPETLPSAVIPGHSVTFSGSNRASISHLDSLYPTLYFFSAFISNWQILWLFIVSFSPFHNTSSWEQERGLFFHCCVPYD